jgi:hypothetical protein
MQHPIAVETELVIESDEREGDVAMPALDSVEQREQIEEDERNCRSLAQTMLQTALSAQRKTVEDVGEALQPTTMVLWAYLHEPDRCCRSWKVRVEQIGKSHFARRNPESVQWVTDDAAHTIDVMMKGDAVNACSLSGCAVHLTQLMYVTHTDGLGDYPKPIPCLAMVGVI